MVATYNRAALLEKALETLTRQETHGAFSYEIVAVDNASTDDTRETLDRIARKSAVPMKCASEGTQGIAYARNRGVAESSGEWIAFFDDDQTALPNWLHELHRLATNAGVECVGGRVLLSLPPGFSGTLPPAARALLGETFHGDKPAPLRPGKLPGTGNVLIKRSVFDSIGLFDTDFSGGCEDADFFRRMRRANYPIWYAPNALAFHAPPPYRFESAYLLRSAERQGANYARLDRKEGGSTRTFLCCFARIGQALVLHLPEMLWTRLHGNGEAWLDRRLMLGKTVGYARGALRLQFPKRFPQADYFSPLDYRNDEKLAGEGRTSS